MVFLLVGDAHLSSTDIKSRSDSSSERGLIKLDWILRYAESVKAQAVFFTGDFLHHNRNSSSFLLKVKDLFDLYLIPCYTIIGNHDLQGDNIDSWEFSQTRLLFGEYFSHLHRESFTLDDGSQFTVQGLDAYTDPASKGSDKVNMLITHHWIAPSFDDPLLYTVFQASCDYPNLKVLLAGHDHSLHPVETRHNIQVVRPGSLVRVSSAEENNRIPCIAELTINSANEIPSIRYIDLPSDIAPAYSATFPQKVSVDYDVSSELLATVSDLKSGSESVDFNATIRERVSSLSGNLKTLVQDDLGHFGYSF